MSIKERHKWENTRLKVARKMTVNVPISYGELLDKVSILRIKERNFKQEEQKIEVRKELDLLTPHIPANTIELQLAIEEINEQLWDLENDIRAAMSEDRKDLALTLIKGIHYWNAERARVKREINTICGSSISEQKDYNV